MQTDMRKFTNIYFYQSTFLKNVCKPAFSCILVNYEYDGDIYYITLSEEQGKIAIKLTWVRT